MPFPKHMFLVPQTKVALLSSNSVLETFKSSEDIPWPITAKDIELDGDKILPSDLSRFLHVIITGKDSIEKSEKTTRLISSIGQDLCRAVTDGNWKLPKHVLLCMSIRHLFHTKQLSMILHRLGHSESYKFGLELETGLTKALDDVSTHLTPQIITGEGNLVFHCEWDNLNKITTNVLGNNIVNSAGGIMIQEVKTGFEIETTRRLPNQKRSDQGNMHVDTPESIPPLHFIRLGPSPKGLGFYTS